MNRASRIYVAGHRGLAGSALIRRLAAEGYASVITRTRGELDLRDQTATTAFFAEERPEYVFLAAAKVGGVLATSNFPAEFLYDNLAIQTSVIHSAWKHGTKKLLFLASSAAYPKDAAQPIREDELLSGPLEPSNEFYAIAKIAGVRMAQAYRRQYGFNAISAMPCNLYGPGDRFDPPGGVMPSLLRRFAEAAESDAPEVVVWGSGNARREFLHGDDLAAASVFLMRHYDGEEIVNLGSGTDVTIRDLAGIIRRATGYRGEVVFDASKPDGVMRKLLDTGKLSALGWTPSVSLEEGIADTLRWLAANRTLKADPAPSRLANVISAP